MKKPKAHKPKVAHKQPKVTPGPLVVRAPQGKKKPQHPHHQQHPQHHGGGQGRKPAVSPGPLVVPTHPHQPRKKKRGLAVGEGVACCSAEALAASLRLAGWPVGDGDVLALHEAAGGSQDAGVSILAVLETAARVGLAGVHLRGFEPVTVTGDGVIARVELPGAHALTVGGPGFWSWGEWHPWEDFPGLVADEAWLVEWETQ